MRRLATTRWVEGDTTAATPWWWRLLSELLRKLLKAEVEPPIKLLEARCSQLALGACCWSQPQAVGASWAVLSAQASVHWA